ncbi:MAG: relaxase/mobilization nuclease domain-containing protein, partial [Eubacterium sp.]|nr:relaxase/mobilization nuclease domain-containing protein [Eubacterium sp.]
GVQFAKEMWGDRFQVIVTTHLDKDHLHNHFCINSVSFIDGKKYDYSRKEMQRLRETSDRICWEHNLSIVKNPSVGTPRAIYEAEKRGEPTKYNLMREAIDFAIEHSVDRKTFHQVMREQGYEVNLNQNRTYWTIKRFGDKKATRMFRLGEEYNHRRVQERINQRDLFENYHNYRSFMEETKPKYIRPRPMTFRGSFHRTRKVTGLKALYLYYCYRLGYLPKKKQHRPLSPEMREAWRRIDRYSENIRLICKQDFKTTDDVQQFIGSNNEQIKTLEKERNRIRARMNRADNPDEKEKYKNQRDDISTALTAIRKDNKTAKHILEDSPKIKEDITKEERAMQQRFIVQQRNHRNRRRNYEWEKTR